MLSPRPRQIGIQRRLPATSLAGRGERGGMGRPQSGGHAAPVRADRRRPGGDPTGDAAAVGHDPASCIGGIAIRGGADAPRPLRVRRHLSSLADAVGAGGPPKAFPRPRRGEGLPERVQPGPLRACRPAPPHGRDRPGAGSAAGPGQHVREPPRLCPRRRLGRRRLEGHGPPRPHHDPQLRDGAEPERVGGAGLRPADGARRSISFRGSTARSTPPCC